MTHRYIFNGRGRRWLLASSGAGLALLLDVATVAAQTALDEGQASVSVGGRWEGKLGRSALRLVLDITKTTDSLYFGTLTSVDQGGDRIPIDRIDVAGDSMRFEIRAMRVTYVAALSADKTQLVGTWTQGGRATLAFTRTPAPPAPEPAANAYSMFGVAAELTVPVRPTLFAGAGKRHLAYEIRLENHSGVEMRLTRLDILDGTATLARWEGAELHAIVAQRRPNVPDNRAIPAGGWALAHVWVTLDSGARAPALLRHRFTVAGQSLEGTVAVAAATPIVVGPPLRGADWVARNGPANTGGHHRRALVPIGGQTFIAQRFAIDWAKVDSAGRVFAGDPADNKAYFGYGAEVIAVADAIVASVKDGIPENVPGASSRAVPMTLETVSGNSVILDLGQGRFAFYAHLVPGSLRVKPGDRVRRGQVIGQVGNSGNSTGPHLHFQISDRNLPLASEGLPYAIDSWESLRVPGMWERRTHEIPMQNARVRFPEN
jgi:murein DD-endopeptidase MepM/ murein hydrolase activator NlpD